MADKIIQPHPKFKNPHIPDMQTYQEMYQESITNPKRFFGKEAEENLSCLLYTSDAADEE